VQQQCEVAGVSRAGFYRYLKQTEPEQADLLFRARLQELAVAHPWEGVTPWKECSVMGERLQFVARRLAREAMSDLCREFGISRKTGCKIFDRYQEWGIQGLTDRSHRPYRDANFVVGVNSVLSDKKQRSALRISS